MKVLIVNKFLHPNGGSETYIFEVGKQLQKMGHQVEYFGMEHEGRVVSNRLDCYTGNMDFHTGKLQKLRYPFQILYSTEAAKKIQKVLDDFRPDVVHVNNFNFQLTPSILYAIRKYEKQTGRTVRIVLQSLDSGRYIKLVALEVDDTVLDAVAAAVMADGDLAGVVAAGMLLLGLEQAALRIDLGQHAVVSNSHATATGGSRLVLLDSHVDLLVVIL